MKRTYERKVVTNLEATNKNFEIMDSVLGQISDGYWENNRRMEPYWLAAKISKDNETNKIVINLSNTAFVFWDQDHYVNPYRMMSDTKVKEFFARKIKFIVKLKEKFNLGKVNWKRDNVDEMTNYLGCDEKISVADAYAAYDNLLGRK